jgi:hypothetical protein
MIQTNLVGIVGETDLDLVADLRESAFVLCHGAPDPVWDSRLNCQLEAGSLLKPHKLLKAQASLEHCFFDVSSVPHDVAENRDHIEESRFAATVGTNKSAEPSKSLVHGTERSEVACLYARKHRFPNLLRDDPQNGRFVAEANAEQVRAVVFTRSLPLGSILGTAPREVGNVLIPPRGASSRFVPESIQFIRDRLK